MEESGEYWISENVLRGGKTEPLGILVESGCIKKIVPRHEARQSTLPRHDQGADPIVPGFVNGHVHLAMAPMRGISDRVARSGNLVEDVFFEVERHLRPEDVRVFSRLGAFECLLSGITEVFDHYYFGVEVARALAETGLTGTVAPTVADLSGPFAGASERGLEETRSIASDEGLRQKGVLAAVGPHATDSVSDPLFQKCAELAAQMQLPVHLHVAQSFAELTRGHGVSALTERLLEHLRELPLLFAHGLFLHDESLQALAKRGAVLAYCPLSQLQFGFLAPLLAYIEAGGAVTIGTDCVASNDAHSVQRELAWLSGAAVQNVSFGSRRAGYLKSGSLQVAREVEQERANSAVSEATEPSFLSRVAFGGTLTILDGRPRGIEVGADANFQVLDACAPELFPCEDLARRLTFGDTKAALKTLVVRGRPIGEPGLFRRSLVESELYRETLAEALRRRDELLARAKVT